MTNSRLQVKAKAIDAKAQTNKILYAGAALFIGLVAAAVFSTNAKAQSVPSSDTQVQSPFELKSQKLSH